MESDSTTVTRLEQLAETRAAAASLGLPIPDAPHAVSVSLPRWADNVGYEEGEPRVTSRMQCGYPRFFLHPQVLQLFAMAGEQAFDGSSPIDVESLRAFVFPGRDVADQAAAYIAERRGGTPRVSAFGRTGLWTVHLPPGSIDEARAFWQHTGEIVSSRMAEAAVADPERPLIGTPTLEQTAPLCRTISARLAGWLDVPTDDVWLYSTGMAAVMAAHRAVQAIRPGCRTVQFGFPYVDILKVQEQFGAGVHFLPRGDADDLATLETLLANEPLAGVFCEVPGNPLLTTPDLVTISRLCREADVPLVVDDTLGAVFNLDLRSLADLTVTSLTKYFSGQGDVMGGSLVVGRESPRADCLRDAVVDTRRDLLYAADLAVLERNSRDAVSRVQRINATTEALCDWLKQQPAVDEVYYPKYVARERYETCRRPTGGAGGLFSLVLREPAENTAAFFDALEVCRGPNLGTNFTLCCPYTLLAHYRELDFAEECGVSRYLLRFSVGLESLEWLKARFARAFEATAAG